MPKTQIQYTVIRDTREHDGHGWTFPAADRCLGTKIATLKTADYTIEGCESIFAVERKGSVAEIAQNLTTSSKWDDFKNELIRLEEFQFPFVICEFPLSLLKTFPIGSGIPKDRWPSIKVTPQFLLMRLEQIWLHFKTKWIFADTPGLGREVASGLFKRVSEHVQTRVP